MLLYLVLKLVSLYLSLVHLKSFSKVKNTIRDEGSTGLYAVHTVVTVDMVDTVGTVDTVDTDDIVYTFILIALHCLKSSWAGRTDVAKIAYKGFVVDRANGAYRGDRTDGTVVAEMARRMNALFHFDCSDHRELKNIAHYGHF